MGAICSGSEGRYEVPHAKKKAPFTKTSKVLVVGGGPAGIHMAAMLHKLGYADVTVLERDKAGTGGYGKTHSFFHEATGDVPNEMGTCYIAGSYRAIPKLLHHYVGRDCIIEPGGGLEGPFGKLLLPAPRLMEEEARAFITVMEWVQALREKLTVPKQWWKWVPDELQNVGFVSDALRYCNLHVELLGEYDYHGIPPRPTPEQMKRINKTFRELMDEQKLRTLLDLCCVGFGSYGFAYDVPALYGLWFVTPMDVMMFVLSQVVPSVKPVQLVRTGYSSLWKNMIAKEKVQIKYESRIKSIDRHLGDPAAKVELTMEDGSKETCDFLVFAAPQRQVKELFVDATPLEKRMSESVESVGLVVSFLKTQKKTQQYPMADGKTLTEQGLVFYPESLSPNTTPHPSGQAYAERNNIRCYAWNRDKDVPHRYVCAYQYFRTGQDASEAELTSKVVDFITDAEKTIVPTPTSEMQPELLLQKNWTEYFPHFTQEAVNEYLPWEVFEHQGENKTFHVGSTVCFESAEDVVSYNYQVLRSCSILKRDLF